MELRDIEAFSAEVAVVMAVDTPARFYRVINSFVNSYLFLALCTCVFFTYIPKD